jgi:hypothetical protein
MTEEPVDETPPEDAPSSIGTPPPVVVEVQPTEVPAESRLTAPPRRSLAVTRLIQALWLGSGAFLLLAASAAFGAASNTTDAANVVGAILTRWHYIALFAPLVLLFLEWRRSRPAMLLLLFVAILLASFQALLDTRIRMMRIDSIVPISSLSHDDPVRRHFGFLHGMSSLFLIGQVIAAGAAVATRE